MYLIFSCNAAVWKVPVIGIAMHISIVQAVPLVLEKLAECLLAVAGTNRKTSSGINSVDMTSENLLM